MPTQTIVKSDRVGSVNGTGQSEVEVATKGLELAALLEDSVASTQNLTSDAPGADDAAWELTSSSAALRRLSCKAVGTPCW
eukprot:CAMPEP_0115190914 /NCGR_PEP_ID=MMETSP0270-20121206/12264_1 /TAXON_ID=71861 /ORGANISM="Scrippsiella trochoidea, Strain CCMP3099" /LENGTH=80 /DNA_ID=CAMNT_0002604127 /DNA_START=76 /DNA_END=315 /DNA_ORIENTATION=-